MYFSIFACFSASGIGIALFFFFKLKIVLICIEHLRKRTCSMNSFYSLKFERLRIRAPTRFTRFFVFASKYRLFLLSFGIFMTIKSIERFHDLLTESVSWFQFMVNGFKDFQLFSLKKTFLFFPFFVIFVFNN